MIDDIKHFTPFEDVIALVEFYEEFMGAEIIHIDPDACYYCGRFVTDLISVGTIRFKFLMVCRPCLLRVHRETWPLIAEILDER